MGASGLLFATVRSISRGQGAAWAIAQTLATRVLLVALSFGTGIIVARYLGAPGRGELTALVVWPPLLASLGCLGLPNAFLYHARIAPADRDALFSAAMILGVALSAVAIGAGFIALPLVLVHYSAETIRFAQLSLLFVPELLLSYIVSALLQATDRFSFFNQSRYLPVVATLVALVIVQHAGLLTARSAALCYLLPPIPMFAWTLWRIRDYVRPTLRGLRAMWCRLMAYGSRAFGTTLLATLAQQIDQVLVIGLLSATSMGLYTVALSVSRVPNLVFMSVIEVITSKTVGRTATDISDLVGASARSATALGIAGSLAIAACAPLVLPWFYGTDFTAAVTVTEVLLAEVVTSGIAIVLSVAFMAVGRPGAVTAFQGGSIVLAVPLMLVAIPRLGLLGAALALLVTSVARLATMIVAYERLVGAPVPALVPRIRDVRALTDRLRGRTEAMA